MCSKQFCHISSWMSFWGAVQFSQLDVIPLLFTTNSINYYCSVLHKASKKVHYVRLMKNEKKNVCNWSQM